MYAELTEMTRDCLIVSTSSETEWLDNIIELERRLYWQELLGQVGGPVRRPLLQLTESERATIRRAFAQSSLIVPPEVRSAGV